MPTCLDIHPSTAKQMAIWPIYAEVHGKSKGSHSFYSTVAMKLHTFVWLRIKVCLEKQENQRPSQLSATKRRILDARPFQKNCCDLILYHFSPQTEVFIEFGIIEGVYYEKPSLSSCSECRVKGRGSPRVESCQDAQGLSWFVLSR